MPKKKNLQDWIEARRRHHLSHAHVQMARELGMNPRKLGKLDNHDQEPWKAPLPQFIEHLYFKRFGSERPEVVMSIEERARMQEAKKAARREAKRKVRAEADERLQGSGSPGDTCSSAMGAGQLKVSRRPTTPKMRPTPVPSFRKE